MLHSVGVLQRLHLKVSAIKGNSLSVTIACYIDLNGSGVSASMQNTARLAEMSHADICLTAVSLN